MATKRKLQVKRKVRVLPKVREKGRPNVSKNDEGFRPYKSQIAFLIGPYTPKTDDPAVYHRLITQSIENAKQASATLWRCGLPTIAPHLNTAHMEYLAPRDVYLKGYQEILKRCDIAILLPGWENSDGSLEEIKLAKDLGIPVYANVTEAVDSLSAFDVV